jgi:hypothetical protein
VTEEDQLPIAGRERGDGLPDATSELTPAQDVIGRRIGPRDHRCSGSLVTGVGLGERERARLPAAQVIDRSVRGDAVEPRREPVTGIERLERDEDLEKDLLREVGRRIARTDESKDVVDETSLMAEDQRPEGVAIPGQRLVDQTLVRERRQIGDRASDGARGCRGSLHRFHSAL